MSVAVWKGRWGDGEGTAGLGAKPLEGGGGDGGRGGRNGGGYAARVSRAVLPPLHVVGVKAGDTQAGRWHVARGG